ncbi:exodeoxyribonuclease VII large subunit [Ancylomarina salipaludis]|uniref:Exodeoxyribonuclease 7 large subunit n=1 Tax=Ancylomarina salipaludis TaxID=2501299 RepID=A0A4V1N0K6_9BACT|nr:exodeoxyribonuclease VII large subunit [Ancylomarina salipaludis]RXQ97607.1 exodeoxyribonuclease VII large subunit [Ancylomarina salipaludis]
MKSISLYQLNNQIKSHLSDAFSDEIWVVAEISELRQTQTGHCYLELIEKDENTDQITAKARATIWAYTFRMLHPYFKTSTGQTLSSGIKVLIKVSVEFQEIYGYSLNIKDIDPTYTLGDMARRKKEVIEKLKQEGVFDMNRDLLFPEIPKTIALISSPTAAGYEDFVDQLENNSQGYKFHHKLFPAIMQGNQAEASIIESLEKIYAYEDIFDVVVIIRGGGSSSDLNCFDTYALAQNIAQFPIPIISGIGHERDESVVDMVANVKVKTPTAAAEFLIDCFDECEAYHEGLQESFIAGVQDILTESSDRLQMLSQKFTPQVRQILANKTNQLDMARQSIIASGKSLLRNSKHQLQSFSFDIKLNSKHLLDMEQMNLNQFILKQRNVSRRFFNKHKHQLELFEQSAKYADPENILKKGYTLTLSQGKIVKDASQLKEDDIIETKFAKGSVESQVKQIKK